MAQDKQHIKKSIEDSAFFGEHFSDNPHIDRLLKNVIHELRAFTEEQAQQITDLVDIGKAMSAEHDPTSMLEIILGQARKFTRADAGTLYMFTKDRRELAFHVVHNDTLKIYMGGTSGNERTLPNVPLYDEHGNPNESNVSAYAALNNNTVNIADVYEARGFNFEGPKKFDAMTGYRSMSMLVLPMKNHENELIGVLQLINAKEPLTVEGERPFLENDEIQNSKNYYFLLDKYYRYDHFAFKIQNVKLKTQNSYFSYFLLDKCFCVINFAFKIQNSYHLY